MVRFRSLALCFFFLLAGAVPASAGHPSVETWSTNIDSEDTTDCLGLTELDGPQQLVSVDNQCMDSFAIDSVTCSTVECMLQSSVQIEPQSTRPISSFDIGLFGNQLQPGDEVDVEIGWSQGDADSGTIALTLTYEGYTGGGHDFDDDGDGSGTGGGGGKADPGCGGCSSAASGPGTLLGAFLVLLRFTFRRR